MPNPSRRSSSSALALFAAAAILLGACVDGGPLEPMAPTGAPLRDEVGATAFNGDIRIGVVPSAASVSIGSAADFSLVEKATGRVLMSGSAGSATVTLESVIHSWFRLQVVCGSETNVAARRAAAEADGHPTFTEFVQAANCTRLFIGRFPTNAPFAERNAYRNLLISQGHAGTDSFWATKADPGVTEYRVTLGAQVATSNSPVVLTASSGIVTIAGVRYRGAAEVRVNGSGMLAGINELPLEEYLYGVVPRELGPIAYPELEALKAQAVAARTYALSGIGKRASDGYDLLATTTDQVYGGYGAEHPLSTRAVDETARIVATHGGRLITALYSSTSGGHTSDNEEVYNSAPVSYLRGIPDAERGRAFEHVPSLEVFRAHANPASLRAAKEGDFDSDWGRYHRWAFEWSMDEISQVISAYAGQPVGRVLEINVLARGPSGRVLRIEYVTEAGRFYDTKDRIRASLRYFNANGVPANLLSTLFFVEPVEDKKTKVVTGFKVYGGGFGHGVGMSQTGAVGMAEKGRTYDEILKHYYREITLVEWS
jgi:stage II sporulation protein D